MPDPKPFQRITLPAAEHEIGDVLRYLTSLAPDAATRFTDRLQDELEVLCDHWGEGFRSLPDEDATLFYSRPVFRHLMRTGQGGRKRRSSAGTWLIYYDVADRDGDGKPDTLRILSVRHGAARPLALDETNGSGDGSDAPTNGLI